MVQKAAEGFPAKGANLAKGGNGGAKSLGKSKGAVGGGGTYQGTNVVQQGDIQPGKPVGTYMSGKRV